MIRALLVVLPQTTFRAQPIGGGANLCEQSQQVLVIIVLPVSSALAAFQVKTVEDTKLLSTAATVQNSLIYPKLKPVPVRSIEPTRTDQENQELTEQASKRQHSVVPVDPVK